MVHGVLEIHDFGGILRINEGKQASWVRNAKIKQSMWLIRGTALIINPDKKMLHDITVIV